MPKKHELYCGNRLKMFRRRTGMTREDLVHESGDAVSAKTIQRWESQGIPVGVNLKQLEKVCEGLQLENGLEDLEKVGNAYLKGLTRDIVQERLEEASGDMEAREIVAIIKFVEEESKKEPDTEEPDADTYDPLKDLVEDN